MDLKEIIRKNPLCLMSVNKTLNITNSTESNIPIDTLADLTGTDSKSRD